jgi:hypothetical protein
MTDNNIKIAHIPDLPIKVLPHSDSFAPVDVLLAVNVVMSIR